jgi:hypothetical protein
MCSLDISCRVCLIPTAGPGRRQLLQPQAPSALSFGSSWFTLCIVTLTTFRQFYCTDSQKRNLFISNFPWNPTFLASPWEQISSKFPQGSITVTSLTLWSLCFLQSQPRGQQWSGALPQVSAPILRVLAAPLICHLRSLVFSLLLTSQTLSNPISYLILYIKLSLF